MKSFRAVYTITCHIGRKPVTCRGQMYKMTETMLAKYLV